MLLGTIGNTTTSIYKDYNLNGYLLTAQFHATGQFELPHKSMAILGNTNLKTMKSVKPNLMFLYPLKRLETLGVFPDVCSGYGHTTFRSW